MDSLLKEIEKIEKRLNTIAEENSLLYEILEAKIAKLEAKNQECKDKIKELEEN